MKVHHRSTGLLTVAALHLFINANACAQDDAHVYIQPLQTYIEAPASCTLHVIVDECFDSLSCFECVFAFDSSLVSLESIEEGQLYTGAAYPTFFDWRHLAPDTGAVVDCVLGYQSHIMPPGELARIMFQAKETGVCPVKMATLKLWDIDREPLTADVDSFVYIHNTIATSAVLPSCPEMQLNCYPNPFNPSVSLVLNIPQVNERTPYKVIISIYTLTGRLVKTIYQGTAQSGTRKFTWDGRDWRGNVLSSGVYFATVRMNDGMYTRKLILIR
jgi:hypothetical protein